MLGTVITTIRREMLIRGQDTAVPIRALDVAARADLGWQDRLASLRGPRRSEAGSCCWSAGPRSENPLRGGGGEGTAAE